MICLIGKKIGMTQVFDERGELTPVTVISFEPNVVVSERNKVNGEKNRVLLGSVEQDKGRVTKPHSGQFPDGVNPRKVMVEIGDFEAEYTVGEPVGVDLLEGLQYVDVIGTSKGKGYQGVMKRHNFGGGRKTHGSKFHRAGGATGFAASPSRVFKGTKMAGRMGADRKTVQNLRLVKVDTKTQVALVKGAVPGPKNGIVLVQKAKKR